MKWLKIAICMVVIIIIILGITLLVLLNINNEDSDMRKTNHIEMETESIEGADVKEVTNRDDYYTIKYILDTYFEYVNYIEASASDLELTNITNQKELIEKYTQIGIEGLKKIMDEAYFYQRQTDEKIKEEASKYKNKTFRIDRLYYQEKTLRKTIFFAYLTLDYNKEIRIIVKIDSMSNCFSILPEDYIQKNNYSEESIKSLEIKDIQSNSQNEYEYISVTDEMMAQSYLEDYANMISYDLEKAYKMIDEEYKQYKFLTQNEYKEYIRNSKKNFEMLRLKSFNITSDNKYKIYTCKDQYQNIYIFKEILPMQYTVQLDDYTLENETFNEKYNKSSNRDKGILNVDKFFKMMNMADYKAAYALLDETFKLNNFKTEAEFERYMQSNIFRYNKVSYQEYTDKITDLLTFKLKLTDATGEDKKEVQFNVVMKLGEETDFTMSFEIVKE